MGNNSAFLQGSASVGKKPNLAVGLSKEQNTTAGPSKANMTAQKQSGSAGRSSNAPSNHPSGNMSKAGQETSGNKGKAGKEASGNMSKEGQATSGNMSKAGQATSGNMS